MIRSYAWLVKRSMALRAARIRDGGEPFVIGSRAGDEDRAGAITLEEPVVPVAALERVEPSDRQDVVAEKVDRAAWPAVGFVAVIASRVLADAGRASPRPRRGLAAGDIGDGHSGGRKGGGHRARSVESFVSRGFSRGR